MRNSTHLFGFIKFTSFLLWIFAFCYVKNASANCATINSSFTTSQSVVCGPGATVISFVNTSTGAGAAGATYTWYLNGVSFDNTLGLTVPNTSTISAIGTYNYMLVAFDASVPCRDTAIIQVFIRPIPSANFNFAPNNQCAGTTVTFSNISTGTGAFTTYTWNFGDGTPISTATSPTHIFANGGSYNVSLTVNNGAGCASTFNQTVTVLPRPNAVIAGDDGDGDTQYCLSPVDNTTSDVVTFFNMTTGAVSYSWNFGDGSPVFNTASTANITHTYNSYGTFTVTMTAIGANGCSTTTTLTVVFDKFVSASFSIPLPQFSGCVPHTVTPVNASQNADTYVWNFGDGTPTVTTNSFVPPSHTYTVGGSYTISVTASNSCNSSTATVGPITIVGTPVPNFTATPALGCSPQVVTFGNTTTGASPVNNFNWNFGNGNTLNGVKFPPPQTYYAGTWTITMTAGNACGTSSVTQTIVVDTIPTVIITATPLEGCTPVVVTTTNNSTGGNLSYQWFIDGILTYTTQTIPNQTFTAPAGNSPVNHTIRLRVSNHCGVRDTIVTIVVHPLVQAILAPATSTICEGSSITFTQSSRGDQLTYDWDFGNGNISTSANPPLQTYTTAGSYTVTLTVTGYCGTSTATATVTVNPIPLAPTALGTTICAGTTATLTATAPGGTYQWYNAPVGGTLLQTGASYTTPVLGATTSYYVQTTVLGCISPRAIVTVTVNPAPVAPTALGATICAGSTATLTATAPGGTYEWYNAAVGGTLLNTGASYTTPPLIVSTTYYVQTTVAGCPGPRTAVTVTVNPIPATPTVAPVIICAGGSTTLTATAPGGTYQWYDSLSGGTLLNTGNTYTTPVLSSNTTYYVQTTIAGCTSPRVAVMVTVNPYPVADIVPSVTSGCQGLSVSFNNNSTLGGTYNWSFAGAVPATSNLYTPPAIVFNTSGNNMVFITVNVAGCISRDTAYINIAPLPLPTFTMSANSGCSPLTTTLNNTSGITAGDTYFWNFGNGNISNIQNPPPLTYTTTGIDSVYAITLVISAANGCSDSVTHTITVHPNPVASFVPNNFTVCANTPIIFSNNTVGATSYNWDFGDANNSTLLNPSHAYTSPGTYTVQLVTTSAFSCIDTTQQTVVIDSVPVAAFSNTTTCLGFATQFTNMSQGSIVTYNWNFGDATTSALANPSHVYTSNGTYNVSLTVTNIFGCTNTITHPAIVNAVPIAAFNSNTACLSQSTNFNDLTSGSPISWIWDFGDGSATSLIQNPSHTYLTAGTFNVTLISFGGSGCSDTITNSITVNTIPTANFSSANVCTNDSMFFNSTSLGLPDTFVWNFGDGFVDNSNNANPSHVYSLAGNYNVTLTAGYSATSCTNTVTLPVTAFPLTVPNFTSTTPCLNVATLFTDASLNAPVLWNWSFGDGTANSTNQNPAHAYSSAGTYLVTLVTENIFGCMDSVSFNTTVNPLPTAAFAFDTVCNNVATTFTNQSVSSVSWNWDFGDVNTSASNSPTHIYATDGTYYVTLISTNTFGCTDTVSHSIIVNPNPVSDFTATTACHTYPTVFTDNSTAAVSWAWNFGDVTPIDNSQSPTHTYVTPGNYNVSLLATNIFGCSNSSSQTITVLPQPVADFNYSVACARQAVNFTDITSVSVPVSWSWNFGDGGVSVQQNPSHTYALGGTYIVILIVTNSAGCSDTITKPVIVNTVPTPLFSANSTCQGTITSFTDLSTDAVPITAWYYNFADGNSSFSQNPNYIYAAAGVYNVSLTVTNISGCDSTVVIPVSVNVFPQAIYTVDTVCIGTPTTFTDSSAGLPTQWTWNFGDGTSSTVGPVISHVYSAAGTFLTSLTVSSGAGCTHTSFQIVVVRSDVQAGITAANAICENNILLINDNSIVSAGFILSQTWDFGDGSAQTSTLNTSHVYPAAGTYVITHVVVSDGGCSSTAYDTVVVNPLPSAAFTVANTCQNQLSSFIDASIGSITSWSWNFGDGGTANVQNPTHVYSTSGGFNATLVVITNTGCSDTVTRPITIFIQPTASFTSNVVCWGDTTVFVNTSTPNTGIIVASFWNFGDGFTSTLNNPTHVFVTQNSSFNVLLSVITDNGCVDTVLQNVNTHPLPAFNFGPQQMSGCEDFVAVFTDNSTVAGGTIVNWLWNFGDGNLTFTPNPTHVYDTPGNYYVSLTLTSSYGCVMNNTLNFPILVYPKPIAAFSTSPNSASVYEPNIQLNDESIGATMWDWDLGDNHTSIFQNPYHTYPDTGVYNVTQIVINQFGCRDTVQHPISIKGESNIYIPNAFTPNSNGLNDVFAPKLYGVIEFKMSIFDRWGNEIFSTEDMQEGWNGRYKGTGEIVQQDVYVYKIITKDLLRDHHQYIGSVTVVR